MFVNGGEQRTKSFSFTIVDVMVNGPCRGIRAASKLWRLQCESMDAEFAMCLLLEHLGGSLDVNLHEEKEAVRCDYCPCTVQTVRCIDHLLE